MAAVKPAGPAPHTMTSVSASSGNVTRRLVELTGFGLGSVEEELTRGAACERGFEKRAAGDRRSFHGVQWCSEDSFLARQQEGCPLAEILHPVKGRQVVVVLVAPGA
jgi:hypothetical protein